MSTEREYEAGQPDPEAEAFVDKEDSGQEEAPAPRKAPPPREPDFDASAQKEAKPDPVEQRARLMGWVPPEEFRGDGGKKPLTAQEFVDRANPAILHERMEKMARESEETIRRLERMNQQALERKEREYQGQLADLRRQRDELIERYAGDPKAIKEINANYEQAVDKVQQATTPQGPPDMDTATDAWVKSHPEFKANRRFAAAAKEELDVILQENAGKPVTYAEMLAELDKRLSEDFPHIYKKPTASGNANGNGAPPADARQMDGVRISAKRSTNYASRLPAPAKAQFDRFVKQGLYKADELESYAKEYVQGDEG